MLYGFVQSFGQNAGFLVFIMAVSNVSIKRSLGNFER